MCANTNPPGGYSKQNMISQIPGPTIYVEKFAKAKNVLVIVYRQKIKECTETKAKCVF